MLKEISRDYEDHLRDISYCPPDCSLEYWLKIIGNFHDKWEGGQKIYLLEEENKRLKNYVGNNMLLSDYQCIDDMRKHIEYLEKK